MDEQRFMEYWSVIQQYYQELSEHITAVEKKVDDGLAENDRQINELRTTVYDEIINPANEYIAGQEKEARFADFNDKYGDKLRPFNEDLSILEGSDFDAVRSAFDQYDGYEGEDKMEEGAFVDALVEELGNKLSVIKQKLGVPEDTEIAVQETGDGDVEVVTEDGEVVASTDGEGEPEADVTTVEVTERPEEEEEEGEKEDDPDELAAFEEELKNYK